MMDSMRDSTSKLAEPAESEAPHHTAQVLQFRPRPRLTEHAVDRVSARELFAEPHDDQFDHLAQYEQDQEEDEHINYPHRMLMNIIAVAIVSLLIGVGVWLADTIADMERDQDCVLQGRQNCAPIELTVRSSSR
jgi:hypothetical protein